MALGWVLTIIGLLLLFVFVYLFNHKKMKEQPFETSLGIAVFIALFGITELLCRYIVWWAGYVFFGLVTSGLFVYYIYRKVNK